MHALLATALLPAWSEEPAADQPATTPEPAPAPAPADPNPQAGDGQGAQRSPSATGRSTSPNVEEWPHSTLHALSLQSERLSEAIFDLLEDVEIVKLAIGEGTLGVRAGRRVFDNHNVLGSWTVVDHIKIELSHPLYGMSWPVAGTISAGFSIGGSIGNDFINIRQVLPRDYAKLEPVGDRASEDSDWVRGVAAEADGQRTLSPPEEAPPAASAPAGAAEVPPKQEHAFDGLTKARYGKLWNILGFPARIPTEARWISHMQDGEVISFVARGSVQAGPSLSWLYEVSQVTNSVHADASIGVYLTGQFRISILRENARYARVRLTRLAEAGTFGTIGGNTDDVVQGFTVVNAEVGRNKSTIKPFTFTVSHGKGRAFDVAFRYDLAQAAGRLAYEQAIGGRVALSEEAAGGFEWQQASADSAVVKVGIRSTQYTRDFKGSGSRYGMLYRHNHDSSVTNSNITATFREGTTRVFRTVVQNNQQWRFIWGSFERRHHNFRFNVDLDRAQKSLGDALTLVVEGEITDTDTSGVEMHAYIDDVEDASMRPGFFPRPPMYRPLHDTPAYVPDDGADRRRSDNHRHRRDAEINYYRSSFFHQLTFSQDQVERFVETPAERMWPALEKAFGVPEGIWASRASRLAYALANTPQRILNMPLYAANIHFREGSIVQHAERIQESWLDAQNASVLIERIAILGSMFSDRRYGPELGRLLRVVLAGEKTSYVIQGSSHVFGYLREEGVATTAIDPLPERLERRIEFDREGPLPQADPEASIRSLSVTSMRDRRIRVAFTIPDNDRPQALYVSLLEARPWKLTRILGHQAILNSNGVIGGGENVLVLSPESGLLSNLLAQVVPGNQYVLKLAYTRDGQAWGPVAQTEFELTR
ncbi:MAG: hypothetical protein H0V44_14575 [Planctomycetes bacterium]|nr:hypothetical protein [Planctomycetota bacterium]